MIVSILLIIGLLLLFLEFYTPGGILAIAGAICILGSICLYVIESPSFMSSLLFIGMTALLIAFVIWFALRRIRKTADKNTLFLADDQEGYVAATFDAALIGREGVALSDFGPSGFILIDHVRYPATSRSGYIDKGAPIVIIGGESGYFIIKPLKTG